MGQELELPRRNSLTEITQKKPDMTIAGRKMKFAVSQSEKAVNVHDTS